MLSATQTTSPGETPSVRTPESRYQLHLVLVAISACCEAHVYCRQGYTEAEQIVHLSIVRVSLIVLNRT